MEVGIDRDDADLVLTEDPLADDRGAALTIRSKAFPARNLSTAAVETAVRGI
jgi:hypothetical protein